MTQQKFNILSLNLWHGNLEEKILDYVSEKINNTSIFCFQEADPKIFQSLSLQLEEEYNIFYAAKASDHHPFYNATFIRKEVIVTGVQTALAAIKDPGLGLRTTVRLNENQKLSIFNTHGCPHPGSKIDTPARIIQSEELIKSAEDNSIANIFIGDFNLLPGTKSVEMFREHGYRNLIEEHSVSTTRNENAWSRYPDNKQLFADYAFIKNDQSVKYDFRVEENLVSDHLPLLISLRIDGQSAD